MTTTTNIRERKIKENDKREEQNKKYKIKKL